MCSAHALETMTGRVSKKDNIQPGGVHTGKPQTTRTTFGEIHQVKACCSTRHCNIYLGKILQRKGIEFLQNGLVLHPTITPGLV